MHIVITGGSGFLGRALTQRFLSESQPDQSDTITANKSNNQVTWVSRSKSTPRPSDVNLIGYDELAELPVDADTVVVNLAGAGIADARWRQARKQTLLESRLKPTQAIVDWLKSQTYDTQAANFPTLISGSAIGWYGAQSNSRKLDETSAAHDEFVHQLCQQWEAKALEASHYCKRLCIIRTGVVLDPSGGMLKRILTPFKLGLGGRLGDGEQVLSWISLSDWIAAVFWLINGETSAYDPATGAATTPKQLIDNKKQLTEYKKKLDENDASAQIYNLTAPNPVTNAKFTKALGSALHRPTVLPVPSALLQLLLGEMSTLLLDGQYVLPKHLINAGFNFKHQELESALSEMFSN